MNVYALNATTGAEVWAYALGRPHRFFTSGRARRDRVRGTRPPVPSWPWTLTAIPSGKKRSCTTALSLLSTVGQGKIRRLMLYYICAGGPTWARPVSGVIECFVGSTGKLVWLSPVPEVGNWGYGSSSPCLTNDGGTLYVGCEDLAHQQGDVLAYQAINGALLWDFSASSYIETTPTIGPNDNICFGDGNGVFYAVNNITGIVSWQTQLGGAVGSSAAVTSDGKLFVGASDGNLYELNGVTGKILWNYATGYWVNSSPAIGKNGVVYVGSGDNKVYAFGVIGG